MTATLGVFVLLSFPLAAVWVVVGLLSLAGIIQKFDPFFAVPCVLLLPSASRTFSLVFVLVAI